MRILIIDDDESIRSFFRVFLEMEKYETFFAVNGEEGKKMIKRYKDLDVIITDLRMPPAPNLEIKANEGIELIRFARLRGAKARIILMSGDLTEIDARLAQAAGADFIIVKPFQVGELKHILNAVKKDGK